MASRSTTNLKQGIQSNSWLAVLADGKLKDKKLETRNTERHWSGVVFNGTLQGYKLGKKNTGWKIVSIGRWWQDTGLQTGNKEYWLKDG